MKSLIRFCLLIFIFITAISLGPIGKSYGQIQVKSTAPTVSPKEVGQFDSTQNFLGIKDIETYRGQTLFVLPLIDKLADRGYDYFKEFIDYKLLRYNIYSTEWKHYGRDSKSSRNNTLYDDLNGKYFIVDNVELNDKSDYSYIFTLTNKENNNDKCYFVYHGLFELGFPFLVMSHYNYLLKEIVDKDFVLAWDGEYSLWKGIGVVVSKEGLYYGDVKMELVSANDTLYKDVKEARLTSDGQHLFEKSKWDEYVRTYGREYMNCVLKGTIKIGMPETLLYFSFGIPERTNEDSFGLKQCVYKKQYVYIKDGKVYSWQTFD